MNGAHLHLALNHVSLFTLLIGLGTLIAAMKRRSGELRALASVLFVLTGVFAWVAVETGEKAEHVVKSLGLASETFIHNHEQAADWAERSGILLAVLALAIEWAVRKKANWVRPLQWALLVFAIHGATVFGFTSYLGGQVRHTEIREENPAKP